jgi:hypothetical protein
LISSIKISQTISIQSEVKSLTSQEKDILRKIKQKKSRFFLSTLAGFLILIPIGWLYSINNRSTSSGLRYHRLSEDSIEMMKHLAPYFYLFIFLLIAGYFIYYYYKLLYPYSRDLKEGSKEILYYDPEKYQTPFFAEYYIVTPISKRSRVKISKEIFDAIRPGSTAAISYSIHSHFIFSIEVDEKEIKFNETNELVEQ